MDVTGLPAVNASLNATSTLLLVLGYVFIRYRAIKAHTMCMVAAFGSSTLFLVSYITYHACHGHTRYTGTGLMRWIYFAILGTHTVLAIVIVPLVLLTLTRALKGQFPRHVAIARVTLPLWLYVSVTGVVIYWMLYRG